MSSRDRASKVEPAAWQVSSVLSCRVVGRRLPPRGYRSGAILAGRCSEDAHNPEVFPSGALFLMNPLAPSAHLHWS